MNLLRKIFSSTKYDNEKYIRDTSIFPVALLRFGFRKINLKFLLNFLVFDTSKEPLMVTFSEMWAFISKKICIWTSNQHSQLKRLFLSHTRPILLFLTAVWLPYCQLSIILKETASLTRCWSLRFIYFDPKFNVNLLTKFLSLSPAKYLVEFEAKTFRF